MLATRPSAPAAPDRSIQHAIVRRRPTNCATTNSAATAVAALDAVTERYRTHYGTAVTIVGLNPPSEAIHDRLSGQLEGAH